MICSGDAVKHYIDQAVRHVMLRQGVLGIKVKIMLPKPRMPVPDRPNAAVEPTGNFNQAPQAPPQAAINQPAPIQQEVTPAGGAGYGQTPGGPPQQTPGGPAPDAFGAPQGGALYGGPGNTPY